MNYSTCPSAWFFGAGVARPKALEITGLGGKFRPLMKNLVEIYDTTLRDGTQGEGVSFSVADKLRVAEKLDAFGVHYVEGGWPGSNPKDIEFFKDCLLYTSPSPRDATLSRMPSSA